MAAAYYAMARYRRRYPVYYGGGPYYAYGGGCGCYLQRERYWDGFGWRVHRVRVCQ